MHQAKGLLLAAIRDPNPVLFFEPKILYRTSVEPVPTGDYTLPIGVAEVMTEGSDLTIVGWGAQLQRITAAAEQAKTELGVSCEVSSIAIRPLSIPLCSPLHSLPSLAVCGRDTPNVRLGFFIHLLEMPYNPPL